MLTLGVNDTYTRRADFLVDPEFVWLNDSSIRV
jgi:hypothetical protein